MRVLLIEDDLSLAASLAKLLVLRGYAVDSVSRIEDARDWVDFMGSPDAVISDYALLDGKSPEFLAELKSQYPALPIALLSGLEREQTAADIQLVKGSTATDELLAWLKAL